jgi:hypothetical protein
MDLVRDVLDSQVVDRHGRAMGRADGIVVELRDGGPPRVVAIEVGLATLVRRIHPRLVPWAEALARSLGVSDGAPLRVPFGDVLDFAVDVKIDVDAPQTAAWAWERWLRKHLLGGRA